jgi:DNA mismatch endonuclease (patch repair protein)
MSRKSPAYKLFKSSSELSSLIKKRTKSKNTSAELILRRYVWKLGLRYRIHGKNLPGKPDLVFPSAKVVVFCDGDFWHGRNWEKLKKQLRRRMNSKYWIPKIKYNIERDFLQEKELEQMGWRVLRFWETDVLKNPEFFALIIYKIVRLIK